MSERADGQPRVIANRGVSARFRELLERSPGTIFYLRDLVAELGMAEVAIQNTAARAVRENEAYKVHLSARAWVYAPNGVSSKGKRMFEELAETRDGAVLIQDEHGNIYKAVEL